MDIRGYRVYRRNADGTWPATPLASPTGRTHSDAGLTNGTAYAYRLTALDTSGNESAPSAIVTATPKANFAARVLATPGLVSHYRLGESSGPSALDAKGGHTGAYTGAVGFGQAGAVAGDPSTSVLFGGAGRYLSVPDRAAHDFAGAFSVELDLYLTAYGDTATWRRVLSKGTMPANRNFLLSLKAGSNAQVSASMGDGAGGLVGIESPASLPLNAWSHLVLVHVPGTTGSLRLYLNGALVASTPTAATPPVTTDALLLAGDPVDGVPTIGRFDELSLYGSALTAAQVLDHYEGTQGR